MSRLARVFAALVPMLLLVPSVSFGDAVIVSGVQTGPEEWTYTVTMPSDVNWNQDVSLPLTTIELTGLTGVYDATTPTSTDFPSGSQLDDWLADVLDGGTRVRWTIGNSGSGNFSGEMHFFGLVVKAKAVDGTVNWATDGFAYDDIPENVVDPDLDGSGTTNGPVGNGEENSTPEPASLGMLALGTGALLMRRRK